MTQHELKTDATYWHAVFEGFKTFEVRKDDRAFQTGDDLYLIEMADGAPTGRILTRHISYVLRGGQFGIEPGYVVLGLR